MRTLSRTPPCVGQCATRIKVHEPRHDAQLLRSSLAAHHPERIRDANVPHIAHAGICLAVAASMALRCPQALASDEAIFAQHVSNANSVETFSEGTGEGQRSVRDLQGRPFNVECNTIGPCMLDAPQPAITDLADALPTSSDPASYLPEAITTGTYVPGPVEVGWQIYVGSAVAAFPFVIGAYEFGKRILIQRRCEKCEGSGLLKKGKFYRKCNECGGFFPWQGWKLFFTSTASPGNGGPLMQPRGQTSVLYKVPPKKQKPSQEDDLVPTSPGTISRSAEAQSRDGPSSP